MQSTLEGETERLRAESGRALELAPNDASILVRVASSLRSEGRFDEAEGAGATDFDQSALVAFFGNGWDLYDQPKCVGYVMEQLAGVAADRRERPCR